MDEHESRRREVDRDAVPVGRPRPEARVARVQTHRPQSASGAGVTIICVIALFALGGWQGGRLIDVPAAGALLGGFVGVIAAFAAIYVRFRDL